MGTFLEVFPKFFVTDLKYRELQEQKRERNAGKGGKGVHIIIYLYIAGGGDWRKGGVNRKGKQAKQQGR